MNNQQKLYPQLIYRINSKLSEIKTASRIDKQIIAPSVFNPFGRNFHWLVVADNKWEFQNGDKDSWFSEIKNHIKNNSVKWEEFKKKYVGSEDKIEIKSIEDAFSILGDVAAHNEEYHHALLTVFQFYPVVSHKYIDGIIYRNLERRTSRDKVANHKIDYAVANLLIFEKHKKETQQYKDTYKLYPWAEVDFFHGTEKETKCSCQEDNSPWYPEELPDRETNCSLPGIKEKKLFEEDRRGQFIDDQKFPLTPADKIEDSFFYNYFLPFFAGYKDFTADKFLILESEYFNQFKHNIVVPLYDAYIDGEYYGNLCGTLQIPFKAEENTKLKNFKKNSVAKLISNSHLLTNEVKESAIFEVLQQPISAETDLLEHFIKYITIVQDWERIMVWKYDDSSQSPSEPNLDYCYNRYDPQKGDNNGDQSNSKRNKNEWIKCIAGNNEKCNECKLNFVQLKNWIKNEEDKHLPIAENGFNNRNAKRKTLLENIFSTKLIPELYPEDEKKYKNTRLIFEYPCYTVFPKDEKEDHKLGLHYERQQIAILRQMAMQLKVKRETMKHGTKAAVAAIISRNHSHHIGSHVVPRTDIGKIAERVKYLSCGNYSNDKDADVLKNLCSIVNSLKGRLDEYVQKKADFVAEIATEPLTTTKNVKLFDEVILGFINNVLLMDNIGANESVNYRDCTNNRLKLYFKVENEALTAKYNAGCGKSYSSQQYPYSTICQSGCKNEVQRESIEPNKDVNIAVPGSLGEFAIFAFFENFIRNGIKHNKKSLADDQNKDFEVYIELEDLKNDDKDKDEFYKVEVYDNFSEPEKKIAVEGNEKPIPLHKYLQSCVQKPIVNDDGSLRKEAWGIAEMKIMATLLRGSSDFSNMTKNLEVKSIKKDGKQSLVYEFYVMKPKNVAIIGDKFEHEEAQKKQGIWWFDSLDKYERHISAGKSPASFKFLIIGKNLGDAEKKKLEEIKKCLPFRVLVNNGSKKDLENTIYCNTIDQATIDRLKKDDSGVEVLNIVWQAWMEQFIQLKCGEKTPHLLLFFQQSNNEEPTKSWVNAVKENSIKNIDISVLTNDANEEGISGIQATNDNASFLVYDRHFSGYFELRNNELQKNIDFHEAFDKNSSDFIHLFTPYDSPERVYELVEAGLLKILVLDERIAEVAHNELNIEPDDAKKAYGGKERIFAARKAGIYICTHVGVDDADLQPLHLSVNKKNPSVCVRFDFKKKSSGSVDSVKFSTVDTTVEYNNDGNVFKKAEGFFDILIIHQGVLENFIKNYLNDKKDYNAFLESIRRTIPYVVIDSGRGIPAKLPDAAKFLPFSLLEDFLMKDRIAKFSLTKNVMSLIRRKQNG